MVVDNKDKIVKRNGTTSDIASLVYDEYNRSYMQVNELAHKLQGSNKLETCKTIFDYIVSHVAYKQDPPGVQWVKTPARLVHDKFGDCKSMAIFAASCLRCLDIDHCFRFVGFTHSKDVTHVYVAVPDGNGGEITIDPVTGYDGNRKLFNDEVTYTTKIDMKGTTNIYRLSGIGQVERTASQAVDSDRYKVWIGDENEANITRGKHYLYGLMDFNMEMLNISTTTKDRAFYLNELDIVASLLHAYNHVDGNTDAFKQMAFIVCCMVAEGRFSATTTDVDARYANLSNLFVIIEEHYHNGYAYKAYDQKRFADITVNVINDNVVLPTIGAMSEYEFVAKVKESGIYFIYMYISDAEINAMPVIVRDKLLKQKATFAWMRDVNKYQNQATMLLSIRSGIIARTGLTPEKFIKALKEGRVTIAEPEVGIIPVVAILAVISIITALVKLFQVIFGGGGAAKPSDANITAGSYDPATDFGTKTNTGTSSSGLGSTLSSLALPFALVAGYLLTRASSKKGATR
jgi:hypothetical protein